MSAIYLPLVISCAHVYMDIRLAVHCIYCSCQRNDLKIPLKFIGVVLFFIGFEYSDRKIIRCSQGIDVCKLYLFLQRYFFDFFEYLFSPISILATIA